MRCGGFETMRDTDLLPGMPPFPTNNTAESPPSSGPGMPPCQAVVQDEVSSLAAMSSFSPSKHSHPHPQHAECSAGLQDGNVALICQHISND